MSNTYMTVNNKVSAPLNWNTSNVTLGSGASGSTYTITSGGTGTSGQFSTVLGANGTSWGTNSYQINHTVMTVTNEPASLEVKGKIVHNGIDLEERLSTIEKILNIPERDVKLEAMYPKLKKMYDEYIKELSKARMWESLKGDNK